MQFLYLHGFASGPRSTKGVAFEQHFATRGRLSDQSTGPSTDSFERLNLRVPSFEHLRLSAMIATVQAAIGERAILIGSSLGGLTASRVAERDPRVAALVLMAPAFQLASRWRTMLGPDWDAWQQTGWREVTDFTTGKPARVDFGFVEDVAAIDQGFPDVRVPTLILHGTRDDVVPVSHSRAFAAGKTHVKLIELDDGHELVSSLPTILAESDAFLDGLPS